MLRYPSASSSPIDLQEFTFLDPTVYCGTTQNQRLIPVAAFWDRADPLHVDGPGAESFIEFSHRVAGALIHIKSEAEHHRWGDIAVFCHEQVIRMIGQLVASRGSLELPSSSQGMRRFHLTRHERIKNCGGIVVTCSGERWERV